MKKLENEIEKDKLYNSIDKEIHIEESIKLYEKIDKLTSKKLGEVFTKGELVNKILDELPDGVWNNPNLTWFDSCAGIGNFQVHIIKRLMVGLSEVIPNEDERRKHILEKMIYIGELSPKNTFILYQLFDKHQEFKLNVYRGDFLCGDYKEWFKEGDLFYKHMKEVWKVDKFDIIIGNPPFHKPNIKSKSKTTQNVKLWRGFIEKSIKICDCLCFISPSSWASGSKNPNNSTVLLRDIFTNYQTKFVSFDVDKFFPSVGVEFSYYIIDVTKEYQKRTKIKFKDDDHVYDIYLKDYDIIPKKLNKQVFSILEKISKIEKFNFKMDRKDHYKEDLYDEKTNENNIPVYCGPSIGIKYSNKKSPYYKLSKIFTHRISTMKMIPDQNGEISTNYSQVYILEKGEKADIAVDILNNRKIYKFLFGIFKYTQYNESRTLNQLPKVNLYRQWTDKDLYEYFNLTEEEIKLIEETVK